MFPALLEVLLPILSPRPAKIIDKSLVGGNELCRPSIGTIHDRTLHAALDKCISGFGVAGTVLSNPWRDDVQRPRERLRIIEGRFDSNSLPIGTGRKEFDRLQLIAVFKHRVRH